MPVFSPIPHCIDYCSSNVIYQFNAISIKILASNSVDIDKLILQFIWRGKIPRIVYTLLKEKKKVRGLTLPNFKTRHKVGLSWRFLGAGMSGFVG